MNPTLAVSVAVLAVVFAIVVVTMALSWRRQAARTAVGVPRPAARPSAPGALGSALTHVVPATYVSTTSAGDWLARVVAHGLGARSSARVQVHEAGVTIDRDGAPDLWVPAADLLEVHRTGGMAGKYVGGSGLVVLRWRVTGPDGDVTLDTGLRTRHAADRDPLTGALLRLAQRESADGGRAASSTPDTSTSHRTEEPR